MHVDNDYSLSTCNACLLTGHKLVPLEPEKASSKDQLQTSLPIKSECPLRTPGGSRQVLT